MGHYSDCNTNGYDTKEGIKYAPESECDCGGFTGDAPTGNTGEGIQIPSPTSPTNTIMEK